MRISDWSSDVCSSDLRTKKTKAGEATSGNGRLEQTRKADQKKAAVFTKAKATWSSIIRLRRPHHQQKEGDRKSVGEGKRVSVRVDRGGSRIIKENKNNHKKKTDNRGKENQRMN